MNQYLLLLHETPALYADMSPAAMKELVARYTAWAGEMGQAGRLVSGEKLTDDGGRHLSLKGGAPVAVDGPYAEAKDVVGGIFVIKAADDDEAQRLAQGCPHMRDGNWIEIRRIDTMGA
ncbi:MAG: YciI family protein [Aquabacterium sp.]